MSLLQLTEYLLWKSIKHRTEPVPINAVNIKQECTNGQEIFYNNMKCRVCINPAEIPITEKIGDIFIISAIRIVANITISEEDFFPKYVCKKCLEELKVAFLFKKKCEASDMVFRKAISHEPIIATSSQPMVFHDFSLLLHEMEQKRLSQKVAIKNYDSDDNLNDEDVPDASPNYCNQLTVKNEEIDYNFKGEDMLDKISDTLPKNPMSIDYNDDSNNMVTSNIVDKKHKKKKKKLIKTQKCRRCNLKFDTKADFEKHRKANGCKYSACPLCSKLVLNLASHERIVHSRTHKYTCHQCGKIYYSSGALINHMHKHKDTKEYHCDLCPYRGKRKYYLVCHMRVHTGECPYLCSMCPLKFRSVSNLRKHQLVHFNKKFECNKCKRLYHSEKHLKVHFDSAHLNIRYRCSVCGKVLANRKKLLNHELHVHKREKNKLFDEIQRVVVGNDNDN